MALVSLGCRANRSDLDALASEIGESFLLAAGPGAAEYVVVNTCSVTADADAATRQAIRRAARENPSARIIVSGCFAELQPEEARSLPNVAAVVGPRSCISVMEALRRLQEEQETSATGGRLPPRDEEAPNVEWPIPRPHVHTRAFLKLQDGCDASCSYCVVPRARGPSRSLGFEEALARIEALARSSPEVVLTGVHLGAYGRDLAPRRSLAELVGEAGRRRLARRIRLSSVEPQELPLELFRGRPRPELCEHVHLPLQSGSARLLAAMRRPCTPGAYAAVVEDLAQAVPGICVGADVMTGFPGETDGDHRATLALVERLPLAYLHVFPFSARPGTAAASMPGKVSPALARERARELSAISERRWRAFAAAQRGRELEVAVESVADGIAAGTARCYVSVRWPASGERRGDLVRVRVESTEGDECLGLRAGGAGEDPSPSPAKPGGRVPLLSLAPRSGERGRGEG